jgi:hypothetical protein
MENTTKSAKQAQKEKIENSAVYLMEHLKPGSVVACVLTGFQGCTSTTNGNSRYKWQFLTPMTSERNIDTETTGHATVYNITEKVADVLGYRYYSTPHTPSGMWTDKDVDRVIYNLSELLFNNGSALIVVKYQ